jgi:nucleoside-diphosphate-sugar epimerase/MoaA/NifB/PqqE/SkfB family radical SAM enzyme
LRFFFIPKGYIFSKNLLFRDYIRTMRYTIESWYVHMQFEQLHQNHSPKLWLSEQVKTPDARIRKNALRYLHDKRILITGATGKAGFAFLKFLSTDPDINIIAHHRPLQPNEFEEDTVTAPSVHYETGDLTDPNHCQQIMKDIDVLVHFAAMRYPDECYLNKQSAWKTNFGATANLLNASTDNPSFQLGILASGFMTTQPREEVQKIIYADTKYGAEKLWLTQAGLHHSETDDIRFVVVRFGSLATKEGEIGLAEYFETTSFHEGVILVTNPDATRRVMPLDQMIDLLCYPIAIPQRSPTGSILTRSDLPQIKVFDIAQTVADEYQRITFEESGKLYRPPIHVVPNDQIRVHDHIVTPEEDKQAIGFGPYVIVPPSWQNIPHDVHLSFPIKGEHAVNFVHKVPSVQELRRFRGATQENSMGDFPHTLELCPTAACSFACGSCSYGIRNDEALNEGNALNIPTMTRLIDQLKAQAQHNLESLQNGDEHDQTLAQQIHELGKFPAPGIFIAGWGEPSVVKGLPDFIKYAGQSFPVSVCTNGSYVELNGLTDPDVLSQTQMLLWSLYAPDAESFRPIAMSGNLEKKGNLFSQTDHAMHKLLEVRDQHKLPLKLAIKILISKANFPLIMQLYDYAQGFNPDRLVVRLANNFEAGQDAELSTYERHMLRQIIMRSTQDQPHHPLQQFADIFLSPDAQYKTYVPAWMDHCYHLQQGQFAMIAPDGNVALSVTTDGKPKRSIGNIKQSDWSKIWGSPQHRRQIKIADHEYRNHACANANGFCRHNGANQATNRFQQLSQPDQTGYFHPPSYMEDDGAFI